LHHHEGDKQNPEKRRDHEKNAAQNIGGHWDKLRAFMAPVNRKKP
jgi:hypothetical protein